MSLGAGKATHFFFASLVSMALLCMERIYFPLKQIFPSINRQDESNRNIFSEKLDIKMP